MIYSGNIEHDPTLFPFLLIDWKITEALSFTTGGGAGATQGPGLTLNGEPHRQWTFSVAGRYG